MVAAVAAAAVVAKNARLFIVTSLEMFRNHDRGTLNVGAPADVALLELREGTFEFLDNYNNKRNGNQRLFPVAAVVGGKAAPRRA
jgi:predicted amidohydrolase